MYCLWLLLCISSRVCKSENIYYQALSINIQFNYKLCSIELGQMFKFSYILSFVIIPNEVKRKFYHLPFF